MKVYDLMRDRLARIGAAIPRYTGRHVSLAAIGCTIDEYSEAAIAETDAIHRLNAYLAARPDLGNVAAMEFTPACAESLYDALMDEANRPGVEVLGDEANRLIDTILGKA